MGSLSGKIFGNYRILETVGHGGMATVYRGLDTLSGQVVAIKFISPALAENEHFLRRFRREVKVVAQLDHPNIVPVLDYGEQDGYAYQVMPFLSYGSLNDRLERGSLSLEQGGRMLDQVASALAYAHQHGVLHRDVKPSNILLDQEGNALLADFGLTRRMESSTSLTGSAVIGTPAYMAPEQIQGGKVDARCDQYALGVVLFQLATGSLPFDAKTPMGYLLKKVNEPFPAARTRNPQVPETIEQVIMKATAKDPNQRFKSVAEMNSALQAALAYIRDPVANEAPTIELAFTGGETVDTELMPPSRRYLRLAGGLAVVLLLLLAVPVFASSILDVLQQAASPAEGSLILPADIESTAQAGTIVAMSSELAGSQGDPLPASEIETAVALTLTAAAGGSIGSAAFDNGGNPTATAGLGTASAAGTQPTNDSGVVPPLSTSVPGSGPVPATFTTAPTVGSPTSSPVASSAASATAAPTATPSPSPTSVPPSQTPTTVPPTPIPTSTPDVCSLVSIGGFRTDGDRAIWGMNNSSGTTVTIIRIVLNWPAGNEELDRIRFNSSSIWNGEDESPPSDISSFTGNRMLGGGDAKDLAFEFSSSAQSSGYSVTVQLDIGCTRSAGG